MDDKSYDLNKLFDFFEYWNAYTHPTEFYNEGWLLKVLVYAITDFGLKENPLYVNEKEKFFSEGLLYSPFLQRFKGDSLAETHTHADGVIGNFEVGSDNSKGSLHLVGDKLNVFEAKINSEFSKKVTNASFYNQAARYVACIAETIDKANKLEVLNDLSVGFYLVVPKNQYKRKKTFANFLEKEHVLDTVEKRVGQYQNEADYEKRKEWLETKFKSVHKKIVIETLFYEDIIKELEGYKYKDEINGFYETCKKYNKIKNKTK
ncbi:hypothetical protein [uncultured Lacinutrix sp.]|uniref:hypothetical protein n=1 Tax=uncultured Lacinutrix sp. TaxID=574032 RepID=UPI002638BAA9|nr:hypothetical protein [uncultured Lacinutrix sp.]